ncbi:tyrosine-type recombinase/integrase [Zavarzinella formosa]|uniref:tyrosine-type recombinase/integrase n=1 Tax=Zavarzinella formosa TaxID=360055 RepID=UPI0002FAB1DC|nr:tyrosine-type recombinase/integrase [Zavarzinella formosa]
MGLIPERVKREVTTLAGLIEHVVGLQADAKPRTLNTLKQAGAKLVDHFGGTKPFDRITEGEADGFVAAMRKKYSPAYVSRLIKYGKQFFHAARLAELVASNPFSDVKAGSMANPERQYYLTREDTQKILDVCPNAEWRLIVALARFGGLRCPSELAALTWDDVDWERNRFLVKSPKTAHHADGGRRWVPLFPELRPYLEEIFEKAEPGTIYVARRNVAHDTNLRTMFERIVHRAGLIPWPKPFQNMRASRETELVQTFPLHVVTAWIGNSARVAAKHYLQVTDADYLRTITDDARTTRQTTQLGDALNRPEKSEIPQTVTPR